jgi:hypothetical protein
MRVDSRNFGGITIPQRQMTTIKMTMMTMMRKTTPRTRPRTRKATRATSIHQMYVGKIALKRLSLAYFFGEASRSLPGSLLDYLLNV